MPGYPGVGLAQLLYDNQQQYLAIGEVIPAGTATVAVQIAKQTGLHHAFDGFSVEASFAGAPGTFELDVQGADTDSPAFYTTLGSVTSVNANNTARFLQAGIPVKYVRLYVNALGNAVALTAKISR